MSRSHQGDRAASRLSPKARLYVTIAIVFITVGGLFGIGNFGMESISGMRAFVGGEALYSKYQKGATISLLRYASSRDESHFHKYQRLLAIPQGDQRARLELEKADPDLEVAHQAFIRGGNDPEDVELMARLFRLFRDFEHIDKAIGTWAAADKKLGELEALGASLHQQISEDDAADASVAATVEKILRNDEELTVLEAEFSHALGEASRWAKGLFAAVMLAFTLVAGVICIGLVLFVGKMMAALQANSEALAQRSEELARTTEDLLQKNWLIETQNSLTERTRGEQSEADYCRNTISFLVTHLEALVGIFYVLKEDSTLCPVGFFALDPGALDPGALDQGTLVPCEFQIGEGLVGQAAKTNEYIHLSEFPEGYIQVESGLGSSAPRDLIVFPISHEDRVVGVLELGSFHAISEREIEFLDQAGESIAIGLKMASMGS